LHGLLTDINQKQFNTQNDNDLVDIPTKTPNNIQVTKSRDFTDEHLFLIKNIKHFIGNNKILTIFFAPCMFIDPRQKKFVMNVQLRQCFVRVKPFLLESQKRRDFVCFFHVQK